MAPTAQGSSHRSRTRPRFDDHDADEDDDRAVKNIKEAFQKTLKEWKAADEASSVKKKRRHMPA